jgi:hypothetical protein
VQLGCGDLQGTIDRRLPSALVNATDRGELGLGCSLKEAASIERPSEVTDKGASRDEVD